jgi:SAM-dependent methyltransferase
MRVWEFRRPRAPGIGAVYEESYKPRVVEGAMSMIDEYFSLIENHGVVSSVTAARRQLEHLFRGVDLEGKRVLDVGGGKGTYSFYAACRGARDVVCLEPEAEGSSPADLRIFETLRSGLPSAPVRLDTRTVQEYADPEGFDIVFMYASINHLDEAACVTLLEDAASWSRYTRVLSRIGELSNSGARLIVCDCSRHNFFKRVGVKNPFMPTVEWEKHQTPEVWASLLRESGFRNPAVSWEPIYRFGKFGECVFANRVAAYFLKSVFCLKMTKV